MNNSSLVAIIAAFQSGYPNRIIEKYKDRIFLTPEAAGVMGNIVGFIAGLAAVNPEVAGKYADDFLKWLDYLCPLNLAPFSVGGRNIQIPARVARLGVDGTCMSFNVCWYLLLADQQQQSSGFVEFGLWDAKYAFQMNGGLIFHGAGETYSVDLSGTRMWGLHT